RDHGNFMAPLAQQLTRFFHERARTGTCRKRHQSSEVDAGTLDCFDREGNGGTWRLHPESLTSGIALHQETDIDFAELPSASNAVQRLRRVGRDAQTTAYGQFC